MKMLALSAFAAIALSAPASAAPWVYNCTAPGQVFHGVKYTKITGTLSIDLAAARVSYEVVEDALPPFDPGHRKLINDEPNMPISQITETMLPKEPGTVELALRIERPLDSRTTENFRLVKLDVPANYRENPPTNPSVGIVSCMTVDNGDRGPEWETYWGHVNVDCELVK
ncbi:MAG: hypothetical protein ACXWR1_02565 [Bdellovibrionota bacterium]